jgi:hypothetical protein
MDQSEYYSSTDDFYTFLKQLNIDTDDFKKDETPCNCTDTDLKKIKKHVNAIHKIIFAEIAKNGVSNKFLLDLKHQINKFQYEK